jgi:hypothetical protein
MDYGSIVAVLDLDDAPIVERADVEGLAAGCGIERRSIQHEPDSAAASLDAFYARFKCS